LMEKIKHGDQNATGSPVAGPGPGPKVTTRNRRASRP
jgi:hypothetical protein